MHSSTNYLRRWCHATLKPSQGPIRIVNVQRTTNRRSGTPNNDQQNHRHEHTRNIQYTRMNRTTFKFIHSIPHFPPTPANPSHVALFKSTSLLIGPILSFNRIGIGVNILTSNSNSNSNIFTVRLGWYA